LGHFGSNYNSSIKNFKFKEGWIKAIIGEVEEYIERIVRFKDTKGINNKLLVLLNNQESSIYSKDLSRP
jgi:hypothetical protein